MRPAGSRRSPCQRLIQHLVVVLCAVPLFALGLAWAPLPAGASSPLVRPDRLTPPKIPPGATEVGVVPGAQQVSFEVILAPSDPARLTSTLAALYDPRSPQYHRWLTPGEFDALFGPSPSTVQAAVSWLDGLGLRTSPAGGLALSVTGSAAHVSSGLGVSLRRYRLAGGATVVAEPQVPEVPTALAPQLAAVVGLSDVVAAVPLAHLVPGSRLARGALPEGAPAAAPQAAATCAGANQVASQYGGYTTATLGAGYGVPALTGAGYAGGGETIAVFELAPSSQVDISAFESCFGLRAPLSVVPVDGGGTPDSGGTEEADLDIEQAATQAPGASILSYEGPNTDLGAYDTMARIVNDDRAKFVSDSWGLCEALNPANGSGSIASTDLLLEQAASQGQSVFVASGDSGSEDCYGQNGDEGLAVDYPGSSPWVTAVGGTSRSFNGTETVWNGCQGVVAPAGCAGGDGAGGGGTSGVEAKPLWQAGLPNPPSASCATNGANCREVPDISADAGVPVAFYTGGSWNLFVGTSIAAPLEAGIWADRGSECAQPATGDAAAIDYQLTAAGAYAGGINDITSGNNDLTGTNGGKFTATSGYDLASGLGSPVAGGVACTEVTSVSPAQAPAGTVITVHGFGLENAAISIGGQTVPVISASATSAQVMAPNGSGTVSVSASGPVANASGQGSFTYGTPSGLFTRVYGATAIGTAIAASQATFPATGSANAVVLARDDFFSDALAGGPLAAAVGGPVLITESAAESSSLDPAVQAEIQRVLAPGGTVYLLGGSLALSPELDTAIEGLGYKTVRLAGADEYATAILVAQQMGNPASVFEATGLNFADALSAVPAAIADHGAILLTDGSTQDPETATYLAQHPSDLRYAIGGPLAAAGADPSAEAIYGADLYATSAAVASKFFPTPSVVGAATGTTFPDALAAGPGLGRSRAPLLLVPPAGPLPAPIQAYLNQVGNGLGAAYLFGGPLAVSDQVLGELDGAV